MLPWFLLPQQPIYLSFFWFGFQWEASSMAGRPLLSQLLQRQDGAPVYATPGHRDADTVEAKCRSAWAAKLALRLLRVYLFFQIQMWPRWCCFYNENWSQDFQFEEPKPLACKSVPISVLDLSWTLPQECGQGCSTGVGLSRVGLVRSLCAFSLASANLTSNASTVHPKPFLQWSYCALSTFTFLIINLSCTVKAQMWMFSAEPLTNLKGLYVNFFCLSGKTCLLQATVCLTEVTSGTAEPQLWWEAAFS